VLCTDEERARFRGLLALGLHDSFRLFEQAPKPWTWWDYRNLAFRKNQGLRIDHILVSNPLKPLVRSCTIDRVMRKNERPSDHAPVVAELDEHLGISPPPLGEVRVGADGTGSPLPNLPPKGEGAVPGSIA
jgi:exonuclease III